MARLARSPVPVTWLMWPGIFKTGHYGVGRLRSTSFLSIKSWFSRYPAAAIVELASKITVTQLGSGRETRDPLDSIFLIQLIENE
jgi:hypothetical protein